MNETDGLPDDGLVLDPARLADRAAIVDLATAYSYAVDGGDWVRWEALFVPDARIDYTSSGGIAGTPAELAAWMPEALAIFTFCLHTSATHEIRFHGADEATGRVQVFNRNGVEWDGHRQFLDVGAIYHDTYARVGDRWKFASRVERTAYLTGGSFADLVRASVVSSPGTPPPFG